MLKTALCNSCCMFICSPFFYILCMFTYRYLILVVIAVCKTFNWRQQKCLIAFVIDKKTDSVDNNSFVMTQKITRWIQGITTHFRWHSNPHCGHTIHALDNYPVWVTYMTYFLCEQHIWPNFSAESFNLWESGIYWFSGTNEHSDFFCLKYATGTWHARVIQLTGALNEFCSSLVVRYNETWHTLS
jgi:hypothetical protein